MLFAGGWAGRILTLPPERRPPARRLGISPDQKRRVGDWRSTTGFRRWWQCQDAPGWTSSCQFFFCRQMHFVMLPRKVPPLVLHAGFLITATTFPKGRGPSTLSKWTVPAETSNSTRPWAKAQDL